ncbi:ATP-binding cassette domain-containing protein [Mariniblastus fucicola]|uniref:Maltose/maltodextrin import ATP-binding protein MalK n=1 Tax=Mariniblastus fucicola TaxID=980251 RepID=A0A5B9PR13_9BACT|nr:ATP-binding cassette domain-containing protein [Mariniblastus fucicola]QEG24931.1 Maltose/maltodextrin import ATP-binding protein MalK [Mariniblastus fucicola]
MIELSNVHIRQGDFELSGLNFSIDAGEYAVLMGPTGCGKTTILEVICGLTRIKSGTVELDGVDVTGFPPARRGIGYVPQDRALFPTMRIDKQIEFGLLVRGASGKARQRRVDELAELTGITSLLNRYPQGLSGGECQRIALARALSFRPRLMCLDEPLSALDDTTRIRIAELLQTIHQQEQVTVLHITHNADDAVRLGTTHFRFMPNKQIQHVDKDSVEKLNERITEDTRPVVDRRREVNL